MQTNPKNRDEFVALLVVKAWVIIPPHPISKMVLFKVYLFNNIFIGLNRVGLLTLSGDV